MTREVRANAEYPSNLMPRSFADLVLMAGALTYAAMYFVSADLFYARFGIEPADVGLGYADLLGQAAVFLAAAAVAAIVVAVATAAVPAAVATKRSSGKRFLKAFRDELASARTSRPRRVVVLAITLAFVVGYLVVESILQSSAIRAGERPTGLSLLLPWSDTVAAHVVRVGGSATRPDLPDCLMRLGEGQGTEIFYDHRARETIRLPQDEIEVTIQPGKGCKCVREGERRSRRLDRRGWKLSPAARS